MTSSSFTYDWETVNSILNKIDSIINYKDSMCDLYTMEYISESPNHCSKGVLQCIQDCSNIPVNKVIGYMFKTNCSSINQLFRKILLL